LTQTWLVLTENHDESWEGVAYRSIGEEYTIHSEYGPRESRYSRYPIPPEGLEAHVRGRHRDQVVPAPIDAGQFHPRIWRPHVQLTDTGHESLCVSAIEQMESLMAYLQSLFEVIHPSSANLNAFGSRIRNVLILASTEVEAQWHGVLKANHVDPQGRYYNTKDYIRLLELLKLGAYEICLSRYPDLGSIAPFASWRQMSPTKSLDWYDSYNMTKHDRESQLPAAQLRHAIAAVAALPVLAAAQFGVSALKQHEVKSMFRFVKLPTWSFSESYYYPLEGESWQAIPYAF
jgi:hypothetical protein